MILVNAPLHKDYLDKIPQNFVDYFEKVKADAMAKGVKVLDYGHVPFDDKMYKDYNHLSLEGADSLTKMVKREIGN